MKTIGIFFPFFGVLPRWFPLFLKSCQLNPTIKFYLFTDYPPSGMPPNVLAAKMTLEQFRRLASDRLGAYVSMDTAKKVCDIRPAFGEIFDVAGLDFWGWGDLDVIYGNVRNFITDLALDKFDVITIGNGFTCGAFSIFRNTELIRTLYRRSADFGKVIRMGKHFCFDELGPDVKWDDQGNFLVGNRQFESFTDVVLAAWRNHELQARFGLKYYNDRHLDDRMQGDVVWKGGALKGETTGIEYMLYHFQNGKHSFDSWFIPNGDEWESGFKICEKGFK